MIEANYRLAPELLMRRPVDAFDGSILRLWRGHHDTAEIGTLLDLPESFVANRLAVIRDAGRTEP